MKKLSDEEMVILDNCWKKPLNKQRKTFYEECLMKQRLEFLFPDTFRDLQLKDKPDLQSSDNSFGIEVTSAIPKDEQEVLQLATDIIYKQARNPDKAKERIICLDGELLDYGLIGPQHDTEEHYKEIISRIDDKLGLLNDGGYRVFDSNYLAIESELFLDNPKGFLDRIMDDIENHLFRQYPIIFDQIFLFNPFDLYLLDFRKKRKSVIKLDTHEMTRCSYEARLMAEENYMIT